MIHLLLCKKKLVLKVMITGWQKVPERRCRSTLCGCMVSARHGIMALSILRLEKAGTKSRSDQRCARDSRDHHLD